MWDLVPSIGFLVLTALLVRWRYEGMFERQGSEGVPRFLLMLVKPRTNVLPGSAIRTRSALLGLSPGMGCWKVSVSQLLQVNPDVIGPGAHISSIAFIPSKTNPLSQTNAILSSPN